MSQECHHPDRTERPASEGDALQRDITSRDKVEEEVVQLASQPLHKIIDLQRTFYCVMCGRNQEITLFVTEGL